MSIERELNKSGSKCELCAATENLKVYEVLPTKKVDWTKVSAAVETNRNSG
jgi:hypothetical protein